MSKVALCGPGCETLLNAAGRLGERGEHLKTFFACLYYAALRPSEAVMLREADLHPPRRGLTQFVRKTRW
jgi:integrase